MSIAMRREYTTTADFAGRLAWAQLRSSLRPRHLAIFAVVLVGFTILSIAGLNSLGPSSLLMFLGYLVVLGIIVIVTYLATRRQIEATAPVGTTYAAVLGDSSITAGAGSVVSEIPYSSYSRATLHGDFVTLQFRSSPVRQVLPAELFPNDEFDRLVAAIAANANTVTAEVPLVGNGCDHEFRTGSGYVARLARAATVIAFTRGPLLVLLIIAAGFGLLMVLVGAIGLLLVAAGRKQLDEVTAVFAGPLVLLCIAVGLIALTYLLVWVQLRRVIRVGSRYAFGFGATTLRIQGPLNSTELPYSTYKRARRRGSFVVLTGKRGYARVMLPLELFPGTELERLNSLITAA